MRTKREGETWHKHKGPHGKAKVFLVCMRCKRAVSRAGFRVHTRKCMGQRKCAVCELPFPCDTKRCPWRFPEPLVIPPQHVAYFRRTGEEEPTPEFLASERAAHRWYNAAIKKKGWAER